MLPIQLKRGIQVVNVLSNRRGIRLRWNGFSSPFLKLCASLLNLLTPPSYFFITTAAATDRMGMGWKEEKSAVSAHWLQDSSSVTSIAFPGCNGALRGPHPRAGNISGKASYTTEQIWPVEERRKDRWTIKRDFALETNEMRPGSFITQKFFEDFLLLFPCLLLLSPQLLSTCSLRMKINNNNGRKGFTQDHRARESLRLPA